MCTAEAVSAGDDASVPARDPASGRPRTDTAAAFTAAAPVFTSTPEALRIAGAAIDYLNAVAGNVVAGNTAAACDAAPVSLDGTACGEVLIALGEIQAKLTAAHAGFLRRFDAADAHDADGYGTSSSWLAAKAGLSKKAAKAAVRQMRQLRDRPLLDGALAAGDITDSLAFEIAGWTRKLPATMCEETDKILLQAHAAGASLDDLATIAACAIERWRQQQPDPDQPDDGFDDRFVQAGTTFGGAGIIRGNLTPECATAVRAVLEALGKKAGPDDERTEGKRFHDALQLACELLLRARLVPGRAEPAPRPSCTSRCPSCARCPARPTWRTTGSMRGPARTATSPAPARRRPPATPSPSRSSPPP